MIKFNVASINLCTEVEGPFKRLTIWFQGCNIHCRGCCNPQYQQLKIANILTLEELIGVITDAKEKYKIEGVTYTGGEPTLQQNLPFLTKSIHEIGLGVISFTGHKYEDVKEILKGCDIVLDGEFIEEKRDKKHKILGSENQRIIKLTNRYSEHDLNWFKNNDGKVVEINIGKNIIINGDSLT